MSGGDDGEVGVPIVDDDALLVDRSWNDVPACGLYGRLGTGVGGIFENDGIVGIDEQVNEECEGLL